MAKRRNSGNNGGDWIIGVIILVFLGIGLFLKALPLILTLVGCYALWKLVMYFYHEWEDKVEYEKQEAKRQEEARLEEERRAIAKAQWEEEQKRLEIIKQTHRDKLANIPHAEIHVDTSAPKIKKCSVSDMPEYGLTNIVTRSRPEKLCNYVVIDTETNGLKIQGGRILELTAMRFENFEPVAVWTTLLNPGLPIPDAATNINGITDDMVEDAPSLASVAQSFRDFVGSSNIVGHNLEFDLKFLYSRGIDLIQEKRKFYDTWPLSQKAFGNAVGNYKLSTVANYCDLPTDGAHRSLNDCYMSGIIFARCVNAIVESK